MKNLIVSFCFFLCFQPAIAQVNSRPVELSKTIVTVDGSPMDHRPHTGPYGLNPTIIPIANDDNSYDVAWLCSTEIIDTFLINITKFSSADIVLKQITVPTAKPANRLLGFCKITTDGSYVIAYATLREYRIVRFNAEGKVFFEKLIFGDQPLDELFSKGDPGEFGTGGIAYNAKTNVIGFYVAHTELYSDGIRHQGGYLGFLDIEGNRLTKENISTNDPVGDTWLNSHSLDQQIFADGTNFITLSLGDAHPRALQFLVWRTNLIPEQPSLPFYNDYKFGTDYFDITLGGNSTYTFTLPASIVKLPNGNYAIVFSTLIENEVMNVRLMILNPKGEIQQDRWITNYKSNQEDENSGVYFKGSALCPRIQIFDDNCLILFWSKNAGTSEDSVFTIQTDFDGKPINETSYLERAILSQSHYPLKMPNGDIIWVKARGRNLMSIFRIKNPNNPEPLKIPLSDIQKPEFVAGSRAYIYYWEDGGYYSGTILEVLPSGYKVRYDDGYEETVENCDVKYLPPIIIGELVKVKHPGNHYYIQEVVEITKDKIKIAYQNDKFAWFPIADIMQIDY